MAEVTKEFGECNNKFCWNSQVSLFCTLNGEVKNIRIKSLEIAQQMGDI